MLLCSDRLGTIDTGYASSGNLPLQCQNLHAWDCHRADCTLRVPTGARGVASRGVFSLCLFAGDEPPWGTGPLCVQPQAAMMAYSPRTRGPGPQGATNGLDLSRIVYVHPGVAFDAPSQ